MDLEDGQRVSATHICPRNLHFVTANTMQTVPNASELPITCNFG
jgi:hypothetical protein